MAQAQNTPGGRRDWSLALAIGLAYLLLYPGVFCGAEGFFYRDYGSFSYPLATYTKESLLNGEIPLWNPYSRMGTPFLAQWATMVLYPPYWLALCLPLTKGLPLFMVGHLILAGLGMRRLISQFGANEKAAILVGFSFGFNGLTLCFLEWPHVCAAYAWTPWVILLTIQAAAAQKPICGACLVTGLQLLTGMPEIILFTWISSIVLLLIQPRPISLWRLAAIATIAVALAAAQLLPFLTLLTHSTRYNESSLAWSLKPLNLLNFAAPLFRTQKPVIGPPFPEQQNWLFSYYSSLGITLLALLAVWHGRRKRMIQVTALLGIVGVILAMNPSIPGLSKGLACTPLGFIRFPIKYVILTVFAIHLLAGLQLASGGTAFPNEKAGVCGTLIALLILIGLGIWTGLDVAANGLLRIGAAALLLILLDNQQIAGRRLFALAGMGVIWLDIATHMPLLPTLPMAVINQRPFVDQANLHNLRLPALGEGRLAMHPLIHAQEIKWFTNSAASDYRIRQNILAHNVNLTCSIPSIEGFFPLYLRDVEQVYNLLWTGTNIDQYAPLTSFLGISLTTKESNPQQWEQRAGNSSWATAGQGPYSVTPGQEQKALEETDFSKQVILLDSNHPDEMSADPDARVLNVWFETHKITLRVRATRTTALVISQAHYPAWKAKINGTPAPVLRANVAFQALRIPAGTSAISLYYDDEKFKLGAAISLLTLLLIGIVTLRKAATVLIPIRRRNSLCEKSSLAGTENQSRESIAGKT